MDIVPANKQHCADEKQRNKFLPDLFYIIPDGHNILFVFNAID